MPGRGKYRRKHLLSVPSLLNECLNNIIATYNYLQDLRDKCLFLFHFSGISVYSIPSLPMLICWRIIYSSCQDHNQTFSLPITFSPIPWGNGAWRSGHIFQVRQVFSIVRCKCALPVLWMYCTSWVGMYYCAQRSTYCLMFAKQLFSLSINHCNHFQVTEIIANKSVVCYLLLCVDASLHNFQQLSFAAKCCILMEIFESRIREDDYGNDAHSKFVPLISWRYS